MWPKRTILPPISNSVVSSSGPKSHYYPSSKNSPTSNKSYERQEASSPKKPPGCKNIKYSFLVSLSLLGLPQHVRPPAPFFNGVDLTSNSILSASTGLSRVQPQPSQPISEEFTEGKPLSGLASSRLSPDDHCSSPSRRRARFPWK